MGFTASETIHRSQQEVWEYLSDWKRAPDWMPGIDSMRQEHSGPAGVGTRVLFRARGADRESEIVEWSPPHRLTLCSRQGGVTAHYGYVLAAVDSGTQLTLDAECRTKGFLWGLLRPLISFAMARADRVQPSRLKDALERS